MHYIILMPLSSFCRRRRASPHHRRFNYHDIQRLFAKVSWCGYFCMGWSVPFSRHVWHQVRQYFLAQGCSHSRIKVIYYTMVYWRCYRYFLKHRQVVAVSWNGVKGTRAMFMLAAKHANVKRLFLEHAALPGYFVADSEGINAGCALSRSSDYYLSRPSQGDPKRYLAWQSSITARPSASPFVQQGNASQGMLQKRYIFCPLQVSGDSQLTLYGRWVYSMDEWLAILHRLSYALPSDWALYVKAHPSSKQSYEDLLSQYAHDAFVIVNKVDSVELMKSCQALLTVNSSMGFQAFFFDKPVMTAGEAFYNFGDMTYDIKDEVALKKVLAYPEKWGFNQPLREAFLNELYDQQYFKSRSKAGLFLHHPTDSVALD